MGLFPEFPTLKRSAALEQLTGFDDAALRRLAGRGIIPAPSRGQWPLAETIRKLCAHLRSQREETLPRQLASMKDVEATYHVPVELIKYLRRHGDCPDAFDAAGRVNILPLLKAAAPFLKKIFSGGGAQIKGIEGLEDLDSDLQLARVRREDAESKARENALEREQIHKLTRVEEIVWEKGVARLRAGLVNLRKQTGQQIRRTLKHAGLNGEVLQEVDQHLAGGIEGVLKPIREKAK